MIARTEPTVRRMREDELSGAPDGSLHHPAAGEGGGPGEAELPREQVGWVAEVRGRGAGSLVCALVLPKADPPSTHSLPRLTHFLENLFGRPKKLPVRVELLRYEVNGGPAGEAVERALLRRLLGELQSDWSRVPVVVPERCLAAQVALRGARYRAVRVLHAYFGDEDGYLLADEYTVPDFSPGREADRSARRSTARGS